MLIKYFFAVCFAAAIAIIIVKAVKAIKKILTSDCDEGVTLTESEVKDVRKLIDYMWHDEERHYEECEASSLDGLEDHIFLSLKRLNEALNKKCKK